MSSFGTSLHAEPPAVVETHISTLFFYGDRVLKLHRGVAHPFVDFRLLSQRRADCDREVALNARLAPDVYLGTATLSIGDEVIEHGVLMRRLPAARNLERLVQRGEATDEDVVGVAEVLAAFHARAVRSPRIDAAATSAALWQRWRSTGASLARFVGPVVDPDDYDALSADVHRYLEGRTTLFDARIRAGAVCDGHGDVQAADIFCCDDGPRIVDCLEFDDALRFGDGLLDAAFLAEDLERLHAPGLARTFLDAYRARSGSEHPASLEHFYIATRAQVRLLVACMRLERGLSTDAAEPARILRLAHDHLRAAMPVLVLVGGPPGSGKSTIAQWLGPRIGASVLSTDHLRASQTSGRGAESGSAYDDAARAAVYERMLALAARELGMGRSVVLDATWQTAAMRRRAVAVASSTSSDVAALRCDSPEPVRLARVAGRVARAEGESDATVEIARTLGRREDPWPEAVRVDTSGSIQEGRRRALDGVAPLHRSPQGTKGSTTGPARSPA